MNNVTLIGMPGSGKSTIGVILAKALRYEFLDSDLLIQKEEKRKLSEIIAQDGPERFMEIENRVNVAIHVTDTVIAPGGSVIYCEEAMEHLKSIGKVILNYLWKLYPKDLEILRDVEFCLRMDKA
jgi:shikimate kinase